MRRPHLSYADVTATLALCIALGGTSYAAVQITGKNVKNGTLTGQDIKKNSLTTRQIRNGSLRAADFKTGQLPVGGIAGPQGPQGPAGARGPAGPEGPAGGLPDLVENEATSANDTSNKIVTATCQPGTFALTGGYQVFDGVWPTQVPVAVTTSASWLDTGGVMDGWTVWAHQVAANDTPWKVTAWVICADEAAGRLSLRTGMAAGRRRR